jgi:glycerol kinase
MRTILAIDQSTSASKAMLFDINGQLVDKVSLPHEQIYPQPGWVEHNGKEIYQNVVSAIRQLLAQNPDLKNDLLCLSITNQRETILVFDRVTGKPLHNAIVWQCRRGNKICADLVNAGVNDLIRRKTGLPIDTYFSASKLKWLVDNHEDIQKKLNDSDALVGTIETYLIYRLTGRTVFASDHTNACRTLLYDINSLRWDEELCKIFDVPLQALPDVRQSSAQFGKTDIDGTLSAPIPICGVMGDSQASLFAQRCFKPGSAKVTFGTGSSVLLNIGSEMSLSESGIVTTVAWVYGEKPTYAFEGITNFTGATIAWLQNQLQLIQDAAETADLASSVNDNGDVYFVPTFVGLSAPYWQPDAKAAIVGLTPHSTKAHVVRAALESIAYRIRDVLTLMAQDAGVDLQHIYADGGAVANPFLMQFVADILQISVRASHVHELSPLGAALSGMIGMGLVPSLESLFQFPSSFEEFMSDKTLDEAKFLYSEWKNAVERVL